MAILYSANETFVDVIQIWICRNSCQFINSYERDSLLIESMVTNETFPPCHDAKCGYKHSSFFSSSSVSFMCRRLLQTHKGIRFGYTKVVLFAAWESQLEGANDESPWNLDARWFAVHSKFSMRFYREYLQFPTSSDLLTIINVGESLCFLWWLWGCWGLPLDCNQKHCSGKLITTNRNKQID